MVRESHIQPFAPEQVKALFEVAKKSTQPKRDTAIISVLCDCGLRAGELCGLKVDDIDLNARCVSVTGKGNKRRSVYFGKETSKALWLHIRSTKRQSDDWVFPSDRGIRTGGPLKPNGLLQLVQRLGQAANIKAVRCSPHTFRHTYAVSLWNRTASGSVSTPHSEPKQCDWSLTVD